VKGEQRYQLKRDILGLEAIMPCSRAPSRGIYAAKKDRQYTQRAQERPPVNVRVYNRKPQRFCGSLGGVGSPGVSSNEARDARIIKSTIGHGKNVLAYNRRAG